MLVPKLRGLPRRRWTEHWRETGKETGLASKPAGLDASSTAMLSVASADTRTSLKARKTARILVVDDEAHVRSMIAATLERQGYEVSLPRADAKPWRRLIRTPLTWF